ncbi:MAG: YciI family protein [Caulobacter sp.]|nr:YciI family protein [Caulobacter sp.]
MALFVISWRDREGGLPIRLATREAHLAYVAARPGVVRLGGPYLSEAGEMAGSMLVIEAEDLAAAQAFHDADPYKAAGLFETSSVTPWRVTVGGLA